MSKNNDKMNVDLTMIMNVVEQTHNRVASIQERQIDMDDRMTEGFANLRAHDFTHHNDMAMMDRRVAALEEQIERISTAQGINAED